MSANPKGQLAYDAREPEVDEQAELRDRDAATEMRLINTAEVIASMTDAEAEEFGRLFHEFRVEFASQPSAGPAAQALVDHFDQARIAAAYRIVDARAAYDYARDAKLSAEYKD